jgi:hypothetical protein
MKTLAAAPELEVLVKRYVWWETPEWAYNHPEIFLANLMNLGKWEDIQLIRRLLGDKILKQVLTQAPPGYFNHRSWDYWHLKFNISPIPPLPQRNFS